MSKLHIFKSKRNVQITGLLHVKLVKGVDWKGVVKTWKYIDIILAHLSNQEYTMCFRRASGNCAICYIPSITTAMPASFGLRYLKYFVRNDIKNYLEMYIYIPLKYLQLIFWKYYLLQCWIHCKHGRRRNKLFDRLYWSNFCHFFLNYFTFI